MAHTYKWTGEYAVVIGDHQTPEGSGVLAVPGEEFTTVEELDLDAIPQAVPVVGGKPKPASKVKESSQVPPPAPGSNEEASA